MTGHRVNSKHPLPANPKGSSKDKGSRQDNNRGSRQDNSKGRELQPLEALKVVREQAPIQAKAREPKRAQRKAVSKVDKVQPGS